MAIKMLTALPTRALPAPRSVLAGALFIAAAAIPVASAATATVATSATSVATGTVSITGTSMPEVVQEAEPCVFLCYNGACQDSGCAPGDFSCVCTNPNSLVVKMGICAGTRCDGSQAFDSGDWLADLCSLYSENPPSTAIASASLLMVSQIEAVVATATDNPVPSTDSIAIASETAASTTAAATSAASVAGGSPATSRTPLYLSLLSGAVAVAAMLI